MCNIGHVSLTNSSHSHCLPNPQNRTPHPTHLSQSAMHTTFIPTRPPAITKKPIFQLVQITRKTSLTDLVAEANYTRAHMHNANPPVKMEIERIPCRLWRAVCAGFWIWRAELERDKSGEGAEGGTREVGRRAISEPSAAQRLTGGRARAGGAQSPSMPYSADGPATHAPN